MTQFLTYESEPKVLFSDCVVHNADRSATTTQEYWGISAGGELGWWVLTEEVRNNPNLQWSTAEAHGCVVDEQGIPHLRRRKHIYLKRN
jgi:hypothetical protein